MNDTEITLIGIMSIVREGKGFLRIVTKNNAMTCKILIPAKKIDYREWVDLSWWSHNIIECGDITITMSLPQDMLTISTDNPDQKISITGHTEYFIKTSRECVENLHTLGLTK